VGGGFLGGVLGGGGGGGGGIEHPHPPRYTTVWASRCLVIDFVQITVFISMDAHHFISKRFEIKVQVVPHMLLCMYKRTILITHLTLCSN